jgi:hypothetical protein
MLAAKVAVILDFSREFQETTSDLNHFAREETVLAGLRFKMQFAGAVHRPRRGAARSSRLMEGLSSFRRVNVLNLRSLGIRGRNLILRLL